jgi:hypothetical protein
LACGGTRPVRLGVPVVVAATATQLF